MVLMETLKRKIFFQVGKTVVNHFYELKKWI